MANAQEFSIRGTPRLAILDISSAHEDLPMLDYINDGNGAILSPLVRHAITSHDEKAVDSLLGVLGGPVNLISFMFPQSVIVQDELFRY